MEAGEGGFVAGTEEELFEAGVIWWSVVVS
jgi:hypothetical protein